MEIFIRGIGLISPQPTTRKDYFLEKVEEYPDNKLFSVEADFSRFLDPASSRRMSRILKLGVIAAKICLEDSSVTMPDGIITGTGYGMVADTEKFLLSLLENGEKFLPPTPFIQSTHNTIGAYVSQMLKCHNYNVTYAHRGNSFESAILDASLLLREGQAKNVLVGAYEENTENQIRIFDRIGFWKKEMISNLDLFESPTSGSIAGEGIGFYMLSGLKEENTYAILRDVDSYYKPEGIADIENRIISFLERNNLKVDDIDGILLGLSGDILFDKVYKTLQRGLFKRNIHMGYKHLTGEFHSSTVFALWVAAKILKNQKIPEIIALGDIKTENFQNLLIYNHWQGINHSLILVSRC